MSRKHGPKKQPDQPTVYEIRIEGQLGPDWAGWLDGLNLSWDDNGDTLLTGPIADQAALFGLLKKVRDLGASLVSVIPAEPGRTDSTAANND